MTPRPALSASATVPSWGPPAPSGGGLGASEVLGTRWGGARHLYPSGGRLVPCRAGRRAVEQPWSWLVAGTLTACGLWRSAPPRLRPQGVRSHPSSRGGEGQWGSRGLKRGGALVGGGEGQWGSRGLKRGGALVGGGEGQWGSRGSKRGGALVGGGEGQWGSRGLKRGGALVGGGEGQWGSRGLKRGGALVGGGEGQWGSRGLKRGGALVGGGEGQWGSRGVKGERR